MCNKLYLQMIFIRVRLNGLDITRLMPWPLTDIISGVRYDFDSPRITTGVNIQWIFCWIMKLLSYWIFSSKFIFDTFLSRNATGIRYVDGSEFHIAYNYLRLQLHVKLWPLVRIPSWVVTLNPGNNLSWNHA